MGDDILIDEPGLLHGESLIEESTDILQGSDNVAAVPGALYPGANVHLGLKLFPGRGV